MAQSQTVPSFDDIIQADRQRKKNEALANEIFGKGRRASTPLLGAKRKPGTGPSLASRVGVTKAYQRASSAPRFRGDAETAGGNDRQSVKSPRLSRLSDLPQGPKTGRPAHFNPMLNDVLTSQARSNSTNSKSNGVGMSIRGLAGPYTVVGSNFAPGTTSADIQSAMEPIGGEMQSCKVVSASPTVIAEMTFTAKSGAENVIATFNNQRADGRLLHIYMKNGAAALAAAPSVIAPLRTVPTEPRASRSRMDVTPAIDPPIGIFNENHREPSDRIGRRAGPQYQDGSYGFQAEDVIMDGDLDNNQEDRYADRRTTRDEERRGRDVGPSRGGGRGRDTRGLYSDSLYSNTRSREFR